MVNFEVHMELMESEVRECREWGTDWINGTGERETFDQRLDKSKERLKRRNQNNGTNKIYEIDGANTTDGLIFMFIYDIDGTYENNGVGVFFHWCQGISETK